MIGPTFPAELRAAGAQLDGLAWGADGQLSFADDYPADQRALVEQVLAAHDPNAVPLTEVNAANVRVTAARTRETAIADIERKMAAGASQSEINADLLQLLKGQP